jgi:hypothetical protein
MVPIERGAWEQLTVRPYGAHFPKKTQFFTTAPPLDVFEEIISLIRGQNLTPQINDSVLKAKFTVPVSGSEEENKEAELTCTLDIYEVSPEEKYCVSFNYRDAEKNDTYGKSAKKHHKAIVKALKNFVDATYD